MAGVNLHKVHKSYGDAVAVHETSLQIVEGELLALLGPSGCGKTTTLRMIAGFVTPSGGRIQIGSRDVTDEPVHRRNVGMVFQGYALFPHLNVAQNIAFGLKLHGWSKDRLAERVAQMLRWVKLEKFADRHPRELSGGQQQRVALARAMASKPEVLLLDEPFSALDAQLRTHMRSEIRALQQEAGITSVFVTHDQEEAMAIADRIGVMNQGRLEQLGSVQDLYERPASRFVAGFIGKCNLLEGTCTADGEFVVPGGHVLRYRVATPGQPAATALCFRPEKAVLTDRRPDNANALPVTLKSSTYFGAFIEHEVTTAAGQVLSVCAPTTSPMVFAAPGQTLHLAWQVEHSIALA